MMRRVHERRGTTNASVAARGDADPADGACLALPELERILALEIDSYNYTVHHSVGERPMDRYVAYYRHADLPDAERLPPFPSADRFLLDFLPYERRHLVRTGVQVFRVDYSLRDLLPMWRAQNQEKVARTVVYDPRSLATIWIADAGSGDYIAVPYRVPRPDMTLAESAAARRALQSSKAADRTETRLFDNVQQVRAIEERGRTATARMKDERSKQARRSAVRPLAIPGAGDAAPAPHVPTISAPPSIIAFEDVEDL